MARTSVSRGVNPCEDTTRAVDLGGAIESLSFKAVSDETPGAQAILTFFTIAGSFMTSFSGLDADPFSKDFASFAGLGGARSVQPTSNDLADVGFDDFSVVCSGTGGGGGTVGAIPLRADCRFLRARSGPERCAAGGRSGG